MFIKENKMKNDTVKLQNKSNFIEIQYLSYGGKTVLYNKCNPNKRNNRKFRFR